MLECKIMLPSSSIQRTDEETTIRLLCMNQQIKPLYLVTFHAASEGLFKWQKKITGARFIWKQQFSDNLKKNCIRPSLFWDVMQHNISDELRPSIKTVSLLITKRLPLINYVLLKLSVCLLTPGMLNLSPFAISLW